MILDASVAAKRLLRDEVLEVEARAVQTMMSSIITADRRMVERGREHGYDIAWLGDISIVNGVLVDTPPEYSRPRCNIGR